METLYCLRTGDDGSKVIQRLEAALLEALASRSTPGSGYPTPGVLSSISSPEGGGVQQERCMATPGDGQRQDTRCLRVDAEGDHLTLAERREGETDARRYAFTLALPGPRETWRPGYTRRIVIQVRTVARPELLEPLHQAVQEALKAIGATPESACTRVDAG